MSTKTSLPQLDISASKPLPLGEAQSSLGTIAEYSSHAQEIAENPGQARRYKLLKTARSLLPDERIAQCQHNIAPEHRTAVVQVNSITDRASFRGLIRCDSPQCPFCSFERSENDRHELSIALAEAQRMGYFPLMFTFTLSHQVHDRLEDLRAALRTGFDKVFSGRWYQEFKANWQIVGKITSSEVTYGKNGWHPHLHILMFASMDFDLKSLETIRADVSQRWQSKLKTLGFSANLAHGVDIRYAEADIADYIAKYGREPENPQWGVDTEIAKANVKRAAFGGLTPFQLLGVVAGIQADEDAAMMLLGSADVETLKKRCAALFCEFFYAYKGRARIHWGKMRKILDLEVALENFELLNHEEPGETFDVVLIERGLEWAKVNGAAGKDLRAELLAVCATKQAWLVMKFMRGHGIRGEVKLEAFSRLNQIAKDRKEVTQ